jgi:aryl-alcohol dehydrogenase-like predicted oxidoreductase
MTLTRKIGPYEVTAVGLGCMPLSMATDRNKWLLDDRDYAISVIHAALDAGVQLLDTADIYAPAWNAMGHNEILVGEAFKSWSATPEQKAKIVIATKGGITRAKGDNWWGVPGRNASKHYLYRAVEASAAKMGLSKIPLWQHHRLDTSITFEEQFENVMSLKDHGYVGAIGLSNVNAAQLRRAIEIGGTPAQGGIVSVQNEFSPRYRLSADVIDICTENGIAFLPWSPLGGGSNFQKIATGEFGAFDRIAAEKGVTAYALTIAWHLAQFPTSIPIPGASKAASILDSLSGADISLSAAEIAELNASCPPDGEIQEELVEQPPFRSAAL